MNKLNIILAIVLPGAALNLTAQQSINASGGESTGVGHASISISQISYTVIESVGDNASLFQGGTDYLRDLRSNLMRDRFY